MYREDKKQQKIGVEVGQHVKHFRHLKGYSQQDLARQIGMTFQQVQKYENGSNRISVPVLCLISKALEVPVISFFPEGYQGESLPKAGRREIILAGKIQKIQKRPVKEALYRLVGVLAD